MRFIDKNFKEIFSAQLFAIAGGIIAGVVLASFMDKIFLIPGMLIVIPGFMAMRGNINGTLASRIAAGLLLNVIDPNDLKSKIVRGNVKGSFTLSIVVSLVLGFVAFIFNLLISGAYTPLILIIPLLAGILSNLVLTPLTLMTTIYLFKNKHDPNNIMGPVVTTAGDVTSILSLLIVILLLV